jgi:Flp pilus assembly protein TadD
MSFGRVPLAMAVAVSLSACAYDPYIDNVRAAPDDYVQHTDEPEALVGPAAALMRVGDATRARGDPASAVTIYRRVTELAPRNHKPYLALADTLVALGAYNDAATAYQDALSRGAGVDAHRGLGNALIAMDQPELALTRFDEAIRLDAGDPRNLSGKAVALDMMGENAAAEELYREALRLDPANATVLNNLALSLAFAGRHAEALEILRPLALGPAATPRLRQNLALVYGLAGEMREAAKVARLDLDEESVRKNLAYYNVLRARQGQYGNAKSVGAHRKPFELQGVLPPPPSVGNISPLIDPGLLRLTEAMDDAQSDAPKVSAPSIE